MHAQVTKLQYWKSEHNEQTCEDAYGESIADGLFAVAHPGQHRREVGLWVDLHDADEPLLKERHRRLPDQDRILR